MILGSLPMGTSGMTSEGRWQVGRDASHVPERSRSASVVYHTPIVKVGITLGWVLGQFEIAPAAAAAIGHVIPNLALAVHHRRHPIC
jgi:hypothetical protein